MAARYADAQGFEAGVISSVTAPFCGDCSRARLSAVGQLYTCLFASQGTDLRAPLRAGASDDDLLRLLSGIWSVRRDRYSEERGELSAARTAQKVEMSHIGGLSTLARPGRWAPLRHAAVNRLNRCAEYTN